MGVEKLDKILARARRLRTGDVFTAEDYNLVVDGLRAAREALDPLVEEALKAGWDELMALITPSKINPFRPEWKPEPRWHLLYHFLTIEELNHWTFAAWENGAGFNHTNVQVENSIATLSGYAAPPSGVSRALVFARYRRLAIAMKIRKVEVVYEIVGNYVGRLFLLFLNNYDINNSTRIRVEVTPNNLTVVDIISGRTVSLPIPEDWFLLVFDHDDRFVALFDRDGNRLTYLPIAVETPEQPYAAMLAFLYLRTSMGFEVRRNNEILARGEVKAILDIDWVGEYLVLQQPQG